MLTITCEGLSGLTVMDFILKKNIFLGFSYLFVIVFFPAKGGKKNAHSGKRKIFIHFDFLKVVDLQLVKHKYIFEFLRHPIIENKF